MGARRHLLTVLVLSGLLGISFVRAQQGGSESGPKTLDTDARTVRLLLGVGDRDPQSWGGQVRLDKGDLVGLRGWRFRQAPGHARTRSAIGRIATRPRSPRGGYDRPIVRSICPAYGAI